MQTPDPSPAPRPGLAVAAFALGLSGFVLALACVTVGAVFNAQAQRPDWLTVALGTSLADAVVSIEIGRRAGQVEPPYSRLRKVGAGFSLCAILLTLAAAVALAG